MLLSLLLALAPAHAADLTVCASGCDHATLPEAVEAAAAGDTLELAHETFTANRLAIDKHLSIVAAEGGEGTPIIVAPPEDVAYLFRITNDDAVLSLVGLHVQGPGYGSVALASGGSLRIEGCTFTGLKDALFVISVSGGDHEIRGSHISDNLTRLGALHVRGANLTVVDSVLSNNRLDLSDPHVRPIGTAVSVEGGVVKLKRSAIKGNSGAAGGVSARYEASTVIVNKTRITGNRGAAGAGGIHVRDGAQVHIWSGSVVSGNTSGSRSSGDTAWPDCHGVAEGCGG